MIKPPIPVNEEERIKSLQRLHILDTPIQENFERIIRITKALFNVPIVAFSLIDTDRQWLKAAEGLDGCETSRDVSFCAHTVAQDDTLVVPNTLLDERFVDNPSVIGDPNIRFYAGHPVHSLDGQKLGSLCIADTKQRTFSTAELAQLKDMAELIEIELNSKKKQFSLAEELDQTKRKAQIDGLTRLWNRSTVEELAQQQLAQSQQHKQYIGIAMIDIDDFKRVNDTYGHSAGDSVLRAVAKRLLTGYSYANAVGRWGGEEFLVVMSADKINDFFEQAELARQAVSESPIIFKEHELPVTITTGLSYSNSKNPCDLNELISIADKALYKGKKSGKNQVWPQSLHKNFEIK